MATYSQCPRCSNQSSGFSVYRCNHCGGMWCYKSGFFGSDGCGSDMARCPKCGREKKVGLFGNSFKYLGTTR